MQPGRRRDYGLYRRVDGTHIGQPSTNIDLERQTSWTTHELTSRRARTPAPRHPGLGVDRRQRHTCHPAQDPSRYLKPLSGGRCARYSRRSGRSVASGGARRRSSWRPVSASWAAGAAGCCGRRRKPSAASGIRRPCGNLHLATETSNGQWVSSLAGPCVVVYEAGPTGFGLACAPHRSVDRSPPRRPTTHACTSGPTVARSRNTGSSAHMSVWPIAEHARQPTRLRERSFGQHLLDPASSQLTPS